MTDEHKEHTDLLIRIDQKVNGINERLDIQNGRIGKAEAQIREHETRLALIDQGHNIEAAQKLKDGKKSDRSIKIWLAILSLMVAASGVIVTIIASAK